MKCTVLDTMTGETCTDSACVFAWEDGNWSCDCNRGNNFEYEVFDDREETGICPGCNRFLVIAAEIEEEDIQHDPCFAKYEIDLRILNSYYPDELLEKYGL